MVEELERFRASVHKAICRSPEFEPFAVGLDDAFAEIEQLYFKADVGKCERMSRLYGRVAPFLYKLPDFPILFINNQPVLKLFMFNIPKKQNKKELIELLKPIGADGFVIKDFDKRGKSTRAHVYCRTLAVSLKFQTASILGLIETGFFSTKQKSYMPCKAKIRPDSEVYGLNRPTIDIRSGERPKNHPFIKAARFLPALYPFLDSDTASNLTNSLSYHPLAVASLLNNFYDNSWPIFEYENVASFIKKHFAERKPRTILFNDKNAPSNNDILKRVLESIDNGCSRGDASGKRAMSTVDLQAVAINRNVLKVLIEKFSFKLCILGEFTSTFEEVLAGLQTHRLEIVGNSHLRGKFLAAIDVNCIKLTRCINLSFQSMADALRRNQRLQVLFMHDCIAFDFLKHLDSVIDAIVAENSTLFAVAWTFSKPQNYPDLAQDFVVLFNLSSSIKFLDISNASFFEPRLHVLLGSIPNVVDLTMINISINEKCNLANLKSLRRLTITWASDIENVLVSLPLESLQTLRLTGYWECPLSELDFLLPIINAGVEVILMNFTMPKMSVGFYLASTRGTMIIERENGSTIIYKP
uniref:Uncharacterized protein n=1 Tax=Trichogramma kaykai TaxID=54128 RepID=A0ABD2W6T8_9HYME